jgi:predicted kinase
MDVADSAALFLVSGAPGSGKTTLISHLVRISAHIVVMDMDELLEDGRILGTPIAVPEAASAWSEYNRLWVRITAIIRRSGIPVLLSCPLRPAEAESAGADSRDPQVHWALLDFSAAEQAKRLDARGWTRTQIEAAIDDAERGRAAITTVFRTDQAPAEKIARNLLDWAASF